MSKSPPPPRISYTLHTRVSGRKLAITTGDGSVEYYILAPPAWGMGRGSKGQKQPPRHASNWIAVVYRGDNPKYHETSAVVGMMKRGRWWGSVKVVGGEGIAGAVSNEQRRRQLWGYHKVQKIRRFFRRPVWEFNGREEVKVDPASIEETVMHHVKHRRYQVVCRGVEYVVCATRRFSKVKVKGIVSGFKVVRVRDGVCVAALEKSGKAGERIKECGKVLGRVDIFEDGEGEDWDLQMVLYLWGMMKGEQEKRQVVLDILMEIAENADGG